MTIVKAVFTALVILLVQATATWAGSIEDGLEAMERGDFTAAFKHWESAEKHWRPLAELGDAEAQFELGVMHFNGYGVEQDEAEGLRLIGEAAEMGYTDAQAALGYLHSEGLFVPQDYATAAIWFRKAAEQGHPESQAILGLMYDAVGMMGLPYDRAKAIEWYRKAAENGVAVAQLELARKHLIGAGVPEDKIRAQMWFSLAGAQGDDEAKLDAETFFFGLTPEERAAAIRMTDEWLAAHPQSPRPKYDYWFNPPAQP